MWRCFVAIGLCLVFCFSTAVARESPSSEVQKLEILNEPAEKLLMDERGLFKCS